MADLQIPTPENVPTWAIAIGSIVTTVLGWQAWKPLGSWIARRLDVHQKAIAGERANHVTHLVAELKIAREEMVELRTDLGEEKELRMAMAIENAELRRDVDHLTRSIAADKRECQHAIRGLRDEIKRLQQQRSTS